MRVFRGLHVPVSVPTVLAIGNFDGVHLGHQALLERLRERAHAAALPATVMTFEPHPREFFAPRTAPARLAPLREKLECLATLGVDQAFVIRFDRAFAAICAESFVTRTLVETLMVRHLIVGDDFRFGSDRQGNFAFLQAAGKTRGFTVEAMPTVTHAGERVSSSAIRAALQAGDMNKAAAFLGRPYTIDGRVVPGRRLGRQLGFATANIHLRHALPMTGVFAVEVEVCSGEKHPGVANLGIRPTVDENGFRPLLEAHLFDFHGDLYGAHLFIHFLHKFRNEMKFASLAALQAQIAQDAREARAFFNIRDGKHDPEIRRSQEEGKTLFPT
jgi:riboflavin kinase/FMN adenylyltransferase